MNRFTRRSLPLAAPLTAILLFNACSGDSSTGPTPQPQQAELAFVAMAPGDNAVKVITVSISGPGIDSTLVFNFPVTNGVASGTARVPAGSGRHVVGRGFDAAGINTHLGDTTVSLVAGANPPVSIVMQPLVGSQPFTLTFGSNVVAMGRVDTTISVGATYQLAAVAVNWRGGAVPSDSITWASSNPAIASVSASGLVTASAPGAADIVASYEGAAASRKLSVVQPPLTGLIVFDYFDGATKNIYRINPDGSGLVRLTSYTGANPATSNEYPDLSPDRSRIVFNREWNIFRMNSDGSGLIQLTFTAPNTLPQIWPRWSPNGSRLVYESQFACCSIANREIHTMNPDGSGDVRLTANAVWDGLPSWSPDGAFIVYDNDPSNTGLGADIFRMDVNGGNVTRLTNSASGAEQPRYSPDGSRILFHSNRGSNNQLYVIQANGSGEAPLTNSTNGDNSYHAWSPNGANIVFTSNRGGSYDLYVMNASGGNVRQLTTLGSTYPMAPSWQ